MLFFCILSLFIITFSLAARTSSKYVQINYELGKHSCSLPWIWDAVYRPYQQKLEVLLIPHSACNYNATALSELLAVSPGYASYFPFLRQNMTAPFCDRKQELHRRLLDQAVMGRYKVTSNDAHSNNDAYKIVPSKVIRGSVGLAFMAPLRIEFSPISRINTSAPFQLIIPKHLLLNYNRGISMSNIPIYVSAVKPKVYDMSMCTVTTNQNKRELVEWIEYHRQLGVQHFFLYDTLPARSSKVSSSASNASSSLASLLAGYVQRGVVSVTTWHHTNCMPDVHVCRIVCSYVYNATSREDKRQSCFAPPSCINHIGALSSCYLRYRHSSKHMVIIDDDEFIHLHPTHLLTDNPSNMVGVQTPLQRYISWVRGRYGDGIVNLKGIALYPQVLTPCNITTLASHTPSMMPRLDTQKFGIIQGSLYEMKWILNTDMVEMLTVHYLTEKTKLSAQQEGLATVHWANYTTEAFLYHYKNFSSNMLFDVGLNPPSLTNFAWREQLVCKLATEWNIHRNYVGAKFSSSHSQVQAKFIDEIRQRYQAAMFL
ncbi:hypothetical protein EON65_36170 [archaeon]|nr:MAG: hypothetical protein EON65_36170 [archaeon]